MLFFISKGWLDYWGSPHNKVSANVSASSLDAILSLGASVNVYMAHGGTNFGFEAGANAPPFQAGTKQKSKQVCTTDIFSTCSPQKQVKKQNSNEFVKPNLIKFSEPTSYDYDAPISESGARTEKYYALQEVIHRHLGKDVRATEVEERGPRAYGRVDMRYAAPFLAANSTSVLYFSWESDSGPASFGDLNQSSGFVLYRTEVGFRAHQPALVEAPGLRDRAHVFLDGGPASVLDRAVTSAPLEGVRPGSELLLLVEDMGGIGYGSYLGEDKGLTGEVKLGGRVLEGWRMYSMPLNDSAALSNFVKSAVGHHEITPGHPSFWLGRFGVPCGEGGPGTRS